MRTQERERGRRQTNGPGRGVRQEDRDRVSGERETDELLGEKTSER